MHTSTSPLRQRTIELARRICAQNPLYVDTETTGLRNDDEIVEISIVADDGQVLLETLVRPSRPIPPEATRIHGITNEAVRLARPWPLVWSEVKPILSGKVVVFYNADFDLRMIQQSLALYKMPFVKNFQVLDLLKLYAEYRGDWDSARRSYRYHSLAEAGRQCRIPLPNAHRSTADTLLTRALLHYIAEEGT